MRSGPCLCGDLYCGSCGDPSLEALDAAHDALSDMLVEQRASLSVYGVLIALVPILAQILEDEIIEAVREAGVADQQYIDYLKDKILELERTR